MPVVACTYTYPCDRLVVVHYFTSHTLTHVHTTAPSAAAGKACRVLVRACVALHI